MSGPTGLSPFALNGLDGTTGDYLAAPSGLDCFYEAITAPPAVTEILDKSSHYADLRRREERATAGGHFGVGAGIDPKKLDEAGWGAIFAADAPDELFEAVRPLLDHRRAEAGRIDPRFYKEFAREAGYARNETKSGFLAKQRPPRAAGQAADPAKGVPYYLLIVGSPEAIPWHFQYDLDVEYAVGRVHFERDDGRPDYAAYRRYAEGVVRAETSPPTRTRTAAFFAPDHDPATRFSADMLVRPLAEEMALWETRKGQGWAYATHGGAEATRGRLAELVGGARTPALLFTAGHGIGFRADDPRQARHQGALVCQDVETSWGRGRVPEGAYFSADDVPDSARLGGLISFHFACFGAGTPDRDNFPGEDRQFRDAVIAPRPFAARLPQRLLGHPNGGSLAFVGHVDRAWGCSFILTRRQEQIDCFSNFLKDLLDGGPVGHAVEFFNERYAERASALTSELDRVRNRLMPTAAFKESLASIWLEHNDARNYVVFGDPAVRLRTAGPGDPKADPPAAAPIRLGTPAPLGPTAPAFGLGPTPEGARWVGRIVAPDGRIGNGVLLSPDLLLVGRGVLPSREAAEAASVEFDDPDAGPVTFGLDPATLFVADERQGFVVVALRPAARWPGGAVSEVLDRLDALNLPGRGGELVAGLRGRPAATPRPPRTATVTVPLRITVEIEMPDPVDGPN